MKLKIYTISTLIVLLINPYFIALKANALETTVVNEETQMEIEKVINSIYKCRCSSFINGNFSIIPTYFDTSNKFGRWALEHEIKRIKYIKDWAYQRNLVFTDVQSDSKIKKITPINKGFKIRADEYYKFKYVYKDDIESVENVFGVGIIHSLELVKKNDQWVIYSDWYTDCFEDALKAYSGDIKESNHTPSNDIKFNLPSYSKQLTIPAEVPKGHYDRLKAIKYADKYCGIPWASINERKYNKKYTNFTGAGGDCTNYVSQCLGDKEEGGGLKFDGIWYCVYNKYGGSHGSKAWVNADSFKNYLIYSGKGRVIKKGTFKSLTDATETPPYGAVEKLSLGDVICYAKGSDADHFALVTGFDAHGYPLINSHTTDRYHVPWDLGWGDNNISFYLIHLR